MTMYRFIAILLLEGCIQASYAQVTLPAAVTSAFSRKFPHAEKPVWEKESKKEYEASFHLSGQKMSANFTADGKWLETETEISSAPDAVQKAFTRLFPRAKIQHVYRVETSDQPVQYEIEYLSGTRSREVSFNEKGEKQ